MQCQNDQLNAGGACEDLWNQCTGGTNPNPTGTMPCGQMMQCMQNCGSDMNCMQNCYGQGTANAQAQYQAIGTCVIGECCPDDPNQCDTAEGMQCQQTALQGACQAPYNECMNATEFMAGQSLPVEGACGVYGVEAKDARELPLLEVIKASTQRYMDAWKAGRFLL